MNTAPDTRPPVTYPVTLADLVDISDAADDLASMKQFYVDNPDVQLMIAVRAEKLRAIVQRAAALDAHLIYRHAKESDHEPQHP